MASRFVTVGRLERDRNHALLVRAFAAARPRLPALATLWVVGDGRERGRLEALARDLGVADAIRFVGYVDDVKRELSAAGTYLAPATEAFGLGALEAMALALPVIASARGGLVDLVEHSRTGLLVEPSPAAFADAMVQLAAYPSRGIALGEEGRRRAREEFSVEQMADRTADAYRRALDCSTPTRMRRRAASVLGSGT
jgi:glycosyltransferase involved in cell wall biosynthesis